MSRLIAIGDVHGCLPELKELVRLLDVRAGDRVIVVGDLVDRGPDSAGVVQYCMDRGFDVVLGNHDAKLLRRARHLDRVAREPSFRCPMKPSADQEDTIRRLSPGARRWLESRPYYIMDKDRSVLFVHAGLLPGIPVERQTSEVLSMIRYIDAQSHRKMMAFEMPGYRQPAGSVAWTDVHDHSFSVVYGHHVHSLASPQVVARGDGVCCYGIDTGCVFGGHLTAAVFAEGQSEPSFVQVRAFETYCESHSHPPITE